MRRVIMLTALLTVSLVTMAQDVNWDSVYRSNLTDKERVLIEKQEQLQQRALQAARRFMNKLYMKANVVDNRYLFFSIKEASQEERPFVDEYNMTCERSTEHNE